ncbi:MAG: FtsW/RodA/SpoVE family cell cycle protein [Lachnospiraceae bacterium]|nr:FtsW/RodA/SpoVE family cell cycle protein [Lachnospiraceae bacterium]
MFAWNKYSLKKIPFGLILSVLALCILGYLVLGSAVANDAGAASTMRKQLLGMIAGGAIILVFGVIDYHFWLRLYPLLYLGMLGIQALLYTPLGKTYKQATRWLEIPGLGEIQPSEFTKILLILFFAWFFERFAEKMNKIGYVLLALALFLVPAFLVFREPDLSSTVILTMLFVILFFAAGISWKWIGAAALGALPVAGFLLWDSTREDPLILKPYMLNRIMAFLRPEEYQGTGLIDQQQQAVLAISSGSILGKGLFNSSFDSVKNGNFLSEENCDFIFAVIGEELGFRGSAVILLLFLFLVLYCFRVGAQAPDKSGQLICIGTGALIGLEVFINIAVTSGMIPNTGIALPFFSAGLSSLITTMFGLAFVFNVALQRKEKEQRRQSSPYGRL